MSNPAEFLTTYQAPPQNKVMMLKTKQQLLQAIHTTQQSEGYEDYSFFHAYIFFEHGPYDTYVLAMLEEELDQSFIGLDTESRLSLRQTNDDKYIYAICGNITHPLQCEQYFLKANQNKHVSKKIDIHRSVYSTPDHQEEW